MSKPVYKVRFTARETGRTHICSYATAKRAREVVELTYSRHGAANIDAEYIGRMDGW